MRARPLTPVRHRPAARRVARARVPRLFVQVVARAPLFGVSVRVCDGGGVGGRVAGANGTTRARCGRLTAAAAVDSDPDRGGFGQRRLSEMRIAIHTQARTTKNPVTSAVGHRRISQHNGGRVDARQMRIMPPSARHHAITAP